MSVKNSEENEVEDDIELQSVTSETSLTSTFTEAEDSINMKIIDKAIELVDLSGISHDIKKKLKLFFQLF